MGYLGPSSLGATLLCLQLATALYSQEGICRHPPDYPGVSTQVPGIFVTPIPGAPFSATVEILSKEHLSDGSLYVLRTINHIARNSAGVTYNERRKLEPLATQGEPPLLTSHIYDPQTRLDTLLALRTHVARQKVLRTLPEAPANSTPGSTVDSNTRSVSAQTLGTETVAGIVLQGTRKVRTISASLSGTGKPVSITDDYWYSENLKLYLVLRHDDPRSGEQTVGITVLERREPEPATFSIPPAYKVVEESPPDGIAPAGDPSAEETSQRPYSICGRGVPTPCASAPVPTKSPDPSYSREAREKKIKGTVVLWVLVGANGRPATIQVLRSLGYGLDEEAVKTVKQWQFNPGKSDGRPVAVGITVEVDFRTW